MSVNSDIPCLYCFYFELPSLPRTVAECMPLNANGSNEDKVMLTYLNPLYYPLDNDPNIP